MKKQVAMLFLCNVGIRLLYKYFHRFSQPSNKFDTAVLKKVFDYILSQLDLFRSTQYAYPLDTGLLFHGQLHNLNRHNFRVTFQAALLRRSACLNQIACPVNVPHNPLMGSY